MDAEKVYRIKWTAIRTGKTGHGSGLFTKEQAEQIAKELNKDNAGWTTHTVERVRDSDGR